jgi:hypothetical protein
MYFDGSVVSVEADRAGIMQKHNAARMRAGFAMPGLI